MDFEKIQSILKAEAQNKGLENYEIYFTSSESISAETLKDEISSFSGGKGSGVSFRCIVDGHTGSAATELFEENELKALVGRAAANAIAIENDEPAVIFEGSEKYESVGRASFDMPDASDRKSTRLNSSHVF